MGLVQGIIAEYNPFHNGHLYQLRASAGQTGAEQTVCIMSGAFVQRGEPACLHKRARAEMALAAGADLVLELPAAFACASAETFAFGAVSTLEGTGIVDFLSFGTEAGRLEGLREIADILAMEPESYRTSLRAGLKQGQSFAVSRQKALSACLRGKTPSAPEDAWEEMLSAPNNILAIEYLKALQRLNSRMIPHTVSRQGRGYKDPFLEGAFPSATAIRHALATQTGIPDGMPQTSRTILLREREAGRGPVHPDFFLPILLQRLRTTPPDTLAKLPYMEPGLAFRLIRAAGETDTYHALVGAITSSRYPRTRIQRILAALLIGWTEDLSNRLRNAGYAQYIRVIGFRESARPLLAKMRWNATLPIVGRSSQWGRYDNPLIRELLALEGRATDTWVLACGAAADRRGGSESRQSPVRLPASFDGTSSDEPSPHF